MHRVLLIDDDEALTALLSEYLGRFGFTAAAAATPDEGLRALRAAPPDLVVLDVMLPGMDGFAVCRKIRASSRVPIVMLTARGDVTDRIVGLELGADDYLAKPFEPRELVARIQAVLRRGAASSGEVMRVGTLEVGPHAATLAGRALDLTTAELQLLTLLVKSVGRVLTRDRIMEETRGLDVLVSRLRQKLGDDARQPRFVKTVRGAGYTFVGGDHG
jgi:DNA-binding response OmpR family regulator